jgi:ribosome-associated toxin RatA of RatAB toxin-antitoxin module
MSTELGTVEGMGSRELVHFVTQQTLFALVNNILEHLTSCPQCTNSRTQSQRE